MLEGELAGVSNELMYELMKRMHSDLGSVRQDVGELKREMNAMRGYLASTQSDINNIYGVLGRQDERLDRIGKRLELREFAENQTPYRPG